MNINRGFYFIKKIILLIVVFCVSAMNAYAYNALSGVDVKQSANDIYNITLKTDSSVRVKKYIEEKDNLTLLLNSTIPADSLDIVYDNASDLKNVIVQKKNDHNTLIVFQGKNIENANIFIKELSSGQTKSLESVSGIENVKKNTSVIVGILLLLFMSFSNKRSGSRKNTNNSMKHTTIRTKQPTNKRFVPSINYKINTSKLNMTVPKDFVISASQNYQEDRIRKAG